jgi:hypothetical protein
VSTFTVTATGMTTTVSGTATYVKIGRQVTLMLPFLEGTSNATILTLTGIPAALAPSLAASVVIRVRDNSGVGVAGLLSLPLGGTTWSVFTTPGGSAWTASGTKTVYFCTVAYIVP